MLVTLTQTARVCAAQRGTRLCDWVAESAYAHARVVETRAGTSFHRDASQKFIFCDVLQEKKRTDLERTADAELQNHARVELAIREVPVDR